ncbi:PmbA protein [Deinobacterium chartae]|uniref:PmbA protein n=1 Tax=Deinobacterium chartae TaxID=521158 RepID=A0A841HZP4_9DEIO|nr:TldD/PmbA family protein [Deinobacterium chartae]MBB6097670.1 PmbA protein [Deinobacterium chartae]
MTFDEARSYLIARARERGVDLEVFAQRASSTSVRAFGGEVEEFKLSNKVGLGLRALVNGAWGFSYTENLSQAALDRALSAALENAELTAAQPHARLVAWGEPPAVDLYGEGLSGVTVERKVQLALTLEAQARTADPRVTSVPYAIYSDGESRQAIANTQGLDRSYRENHASQYVAPLVSENGQNKMKGEFQFSREFEELDPTRTALEAVRRSAALLGARPAPSGTCGAVIDARCAAHLLAVYSAIFSAKMVQEGKSPLAGKLGQAVADSRVTLVDDPTLPRGLASRPFDAEGAPSRPLTLLEAGVLRSFLHNAETAARDGVEPTGHAARASYKSTLGISPTNLFVQAGSGSREDLLRRLGTGLLLTDVQGTHAGANPITGEFSLQAEGFWVEGGQIAYPLEVFTVAGNFLELLSEVQEVGADLEFTQYGTGSPSLRVTRLAVGGN